MFPKKSVDMYDLMFFLLCKGPKLALFKNTLFCSLKTIAKRSYNEYVPAPLRMPQARIGDPLRRRMYSCLTVSATENTTLCNK